MNEIKTVDCEIGIEYIDIHESKVEVNGKTLIWISTGDVDNFIQDLQLILDKYRT
nr:hypothetical protein [uncultured Butyricimonas sp.]DAZ13416.1 MAG TPA: hypothetical protein [Caudoviricetes sp.]